jgi:hypothetical protein
MNWRAFVGVMVLLCGGCEAGDGVIEPVWNKQACDHCRMLLSEPRYAAQVLTEESERLYFDDIGCMASYLVKRSVRFRHAWVHAEGGGWVDAQRARYRTDATTPMGFGYAPSAAGSLDFAGVKQRLANQQLAKDAL